MRRSLRTLSLVALLLASTILAGCGVALPAGGALAAIFLSNKSGSNKVIVIRSKDTNVVLARGPFDLGDTTEGRGQAVVATQLQVTATNDATLQSLDFSITGTGDTSSLPVTLYLDV